jgi:eukaryotic-like serine/threonine-protein kinase
MSHLEDPKPETLENEPRRRPESQFSRWSGMTLMVAILFVAGILSALTAMRFAIRGREVVVPSLIGIKEDQAADLLARNGLVLKVVSSKRFSTEIPEGHVLEQIPPSGTRLKSGRSVKVLLSVGERRFAVPNLAGTSLRAAQLTLSQRRLTLGNTLYAHTPEGEPSTVTYQSPRPGTVEGSDPSVNILISLGPPAQDFIMPDLIGKPAELVSNRARNEGFKIGKVNYRKYPGVDPGVVIQQKPQAGYRISKSEVILLDVSQ